MPEHTAIGVMEAFGLLSRRQRREFLRDEAAMHGRPVYRERGHRLGLHLLEPHPRYRRRWGGAAATTRS